MPSVRESDPPLRSVENEIVEAFERALKTEWREDATPLVLEPADSHALASYQAEVLTAAISCIRLLAAEVDNLRAIA